MSNLLVVDDDHTFRRMLCRTLAELGHETTEAHDGLDAIEKLESLRFDLVVTDLDMPRADGFAVIEAIHRRFRGTPVVMVTGSTRIDCVSALRAGATDFLMKPCHPSELERVVKGALAGRENERVTVRPQAALLGESASMKAVFEDIERVSVLEVPVCFRAEAGSGTEAFARLLHGLSKRGAEAFVSLSPLCCGDEAILEAARAAQRGTLFLEDIAAMPRATQATVAKIIERTRRDGAGPRVIASAPPALELLVEDGRLDVDLAPLLHETRVSLPPLRDRPEDVPLLLRHFLDEANRRHGRDVDVRDGTTDALVSYQFPGNVSELEQMIEHLVLRAPQPGGDEIVEDAELAVHFVEAKLTMHDGVQRDVALLTCGSQTVTSFLLDGDSFFLAEESSVARHFARAAVAMVRVDQRIAADEASPSLPLQLRRARVRFLSGQQVEGEIRWVRGVTRRSISDILCDPAKVFVLHAGDATCFIAKAHVAWLEEIS